MVLSMFDYNRDIAWFWFCFICIYMYIYTYAYSFLDKENAADPDYLI